MGCPSTERDISSSSARSNLMQVGSGRERRGEAVCQGELERGALGLGGAREKGVEGMSGSPDPCFLGQNI